MIRAALASVFLSSPAFAHPGHEERGLILAFLDHLVSDVPALIAALLCIAVVVLLRLKKRKAK